MWPLDAPEDFLTRTSVIIGSASDSGNPGILQNKFCHFTDATSGNKRVDLTPGPVYNRLHTVATASSVVGPKGITIPGGNSQSNRW